jgi:hypothetical protein
MTPKWPALSWPRRLIAFNPLWVADPGALHAGGGCSPLPRHLPQPHHPRRPRRPDRRPQPAGALPAGAAAGGGVGVTGACWGQGLKVPLGVSTRPKLLAVEAQLRIPLRVPALPVPACSSSPRLLGAWLVAGWGELSRERPARHPGRLGCGCRPAPRTARATPARNGSHGDQSRRNGVNEAPTTVPIKPIASFWRSASSRWMVTDHTPCPLTGAACNSRSLGSSMISAPPG